MTTTPPTTELAKQYRPEDVESEVAKRWHDANAFHAEPTDSGKPYSIVIPPPNVTAALHMGHALNNTLQDILTRWHRMLGDNAMWMPGTDHAGIATQTVVDKRLQAEGQPALKDYKKLEAEGKPGREQFIDKVQAWKDEYEGVITGQLKSMGCSCDWERQRFTMDPQCAKAVREAFFRLFKDGLIYRGKRLVNWDPVTQTALADDEVEMQDVDGSFWYMKYPIIDDNGKPTGEHVTVATTRPETMLGDTAVAVNPRDTVRGKYIGKRVVLPIVGRPILIVGDDYVVIPDPDSDDAKAKMASGFLKVTPAHDPNDWEIGQRHALNVINVMGPDASISRDHGWDDFDQWLDKPTADRETLFSLLGQPREQARKTIVRWFENHGLLEDTKPYRHAVGHSYRSHVPVEPYLSDQWYVKVTDDRLRGAAIDAMVPDQRTPLSEAYLYERQLSREQFAKDHLPAAPGSAGGSYGGPDHGGSSANQPPAEPGAEGCKDQLRFYPERYARTFQQWHENLRDWCISRQLWWGHRIPVWTIKCTKDMPTYGPFLDAMICLGFSNNDFIIREENLDDCKILQWCTRTEEADKALKVLIDLGTGEIDLAQARQFFKDRNTEPNLLEFCQACIIEGGQDPDVLDTWFSSGLWPLSTLGWPGDTAELKTWNPTDVLCTAREIITLWVSRMVMFNTYLHGKLPFKDVFIHAMIQDGHGQKMSKSLGNGVDPNDIIHSHGADAMRFTLTSMTTQTQDVRMPVDMVCPHTQKTFTPKFITTGSSQSKVAAPIQDSPFAKGKKMTSSFGVASGQAKATKEAPLARNTSEKFDYGRNFANKLWNATRFALSNIEEATGDTGEDNHSGGSLADKWITARAIEAVQAADKALGGYDFHNYAQSLYGFIWNDLCDWYIEAVKGTVKQNATTRRVLATMIDVSLRLLHPTMPFITEKLWDRLNAVAPERSVDGLTLPPSELLVSASWPKADPGAIDQDAEASFARVQDAVAMVREVRATNKVPPRQQVDVSVKVSDEVYAKLKPNQGVLETLANVKVVVVGPNVEKPADAAAVVRPNIEVYLHGQLDSESEKTRLTMRAEELDKQIKNLRGRLSNESYVSKAPEKLVNETKQQLADAEAEAEKVAEQLSGL
jgi:valyl-tRNA synthetase